MFEWNEYWWRFQLHSVLFCKLSFLLKYSMLLFEWYEILHKIYLCGWYTSEGHVPHRRVSTLPQDYEEGTCIWKHTFLSVCLRVTAVDWSFALYYFQISWLYLPVIFSSLWECFLDFAKLILSLAGLILVKHIFRASTHWNIIINIHVLSVSLFVCLSICLFSLLLFSHHFVWSCTGKERFNHFICLSLQRASSILFIFQLQNELSHNFRFCYVDASGSISESIGMLLSSSSSSSSSSSLSFFLHSITWILFQTTYAWKTIKELQYMGVVNQLLSSVINQFMGRKLFPPFSM